MAERTFNDVGSVVGDIGGVRAGRVGNSGGNVACGVGTAGDDVIADDVAADGVKTECDEVAGFELVFRNVGGDRGEMGGLAQMTAGARRAGTVSGGRREVRMGLKVVRTGQQVELTVYDGLQRVEWVGRG